MSEATTNQQQCGGKKKAMLAYGVIQISATVVSAISLAAIAIGLCAVKQESKLFNGCVDAWDHPWAPCQKTGSDSLVG